MNDRATHANAAGTWTQYPASKMRALLPAKDSAAGNYQVTQVRYQSGTCSHLSTNHFKEACHKIGYPQAIENGFRAKFTLLISLPLNKISIPPNQILLRFVIETHTIKK